MSRYIATNEDQSVTTREIMPEYIYCCFWMPALNLNIGWKYAVEIYKIIPKQI